jgi:hypothetical protein
MVLRGSRPVRHGIHGMGGGLDPCSDMDFDGGESVEATVCKHEATEMLVRRSEWEQTHAVPSDGGAVPARRA